MEAEMEKSIYTYSGCCVATVDCRSVNRLPWLMVMIPVALYLLFLRDAWFGTPKGEWYYPADIFVGGRASKLHPDLSSCVFVAANGHKSRFFYPTRHRRYCICKVRRPSEVDVTW